MLQGAAVAAVLCALQQRASLAPSELPGDAEPWPPLRFAVMCSGFPSPCPEHQQLLAAEAPLRLPSLHIYGAQHRADRQARPCVASTSRACSIYASLTCQSLHEQVQLGLEPMLLLHSAFPTAMPEGVFVMPAALQGVAGGW